ncbi:MAG: hypothetical protein ACTHMY_04310 [Solirubrobacteraceae bacterium]
MRPARTIATLAVTLAVAGCGATPPQAPHSEAKKLGASTGDISTECGLAYQVTAFAGDHRKQLASLESQAKASARSLAAVYARNQAWIYQGETVHDIVRDALSMLSSCGLTKAQSALAHETYARRRG